MSLAPPYTLADARALVAGCTEGEEEAWDRLSERYGRLVEAVVVRVVDERRGGNLDEVPKCVDAVVAYLRGDRGAVLRAWKETATLRHYLAVVTRQVAMEFMQDVTPPATLIASLPTPAAMFLDEILAVEPAQQVSDVLSRMAPNVAALVRLRLKGMTRADIGATLGVAPQTAASHLDHVATRLGEMMGDDAADGIKAWRVVLDASTTAERVEVAIRTEDEERFRQVRSLAEGTWRAVRENTLTALHPKQPNCLDEETTAAFVGGQLKGADRTRAEGHIASCVRCIDLVATATMDMRTVEALRDAAGVDDRLALAAACASTTRFRAAEQLASIAAMAGTERAREIVRLARLGRSLVGGRRDVGPSAEPSRIVATKIPADEEAPIVALESLLMDDAHAAARAIDDELAKGTLGTRLRLLACIAGYDLEGGKTIAAELIERSHSDPDLMADAEAAQALPDERALPREILFERMRSVLPQATRFVTSA